MNSCTIDMPSAWSFRAQAPSPTMWTAYSTAATRVSASPYPTEKPSRVSTASPAVASATAPQVIGPIRVPSRSAARSGVHTTYIPVMKPETLAGVWARPVVCRICATP